MPVFILVPDQAVSNEPAAATSRIVVLATQGRSTFGRISSSAIRATAALKGFLRKLGRAYEQDAVVYKNYYRDVELHALNDLPDLGMANRETRSLGRFSPDLVGHYFTLMTRRGAPPLSLDKLHAGWDGEDWLGGRWEDVGFWTPKSFSARPADVRAIRGDKGRLDGRPTSDGNGYGGRAPGPAAPSAFRSLARMRCRPPATTAPGDVASRLLPSTSGGRAG